MVKGRSARGELVDFDLLKIKEQIASAPKTTNVVAREDFIDQKFRRRLKKLTDDVTVSATQVTTDVVPVPEVEDVAEPDEFTESNDNEDMMEMMGFVDQSESTEDNSASEPLVAEVAEPAVPTSSKKTLGPQ